MPKTTYLTEAGTISPRDWRRLPVVVHRDPVFFHKSQIRLVTVLLPRANVSRDYLGLPEDLDVQRAQPVNDNDAAEANWRLES